MDLCMQSALAKCEVWIHHSRMELDEILEAIVWIRTLMVANDSNSDQLEGRKGTYQRELSGAKPGFRHAGL